MPKHKQVMSVRETHPLAELEKTIARGKERFVEMGMALGIIHDLRLYKRGYSSFDKYCRATLGCGRQQGYRLMQAAKAGRSNTRVTPCSQGRKLDQTTSVGGSNTRVTPYDPDHATAADEGRQVAASEQETQMN